MFNHNSGYSGSSMSLRAVDAYENGEMPLSKWRKTDILNGIADIDPQKAEKLKKVKVNILKEKLLVCSSWHHTSNHFNKTKFYSIDTDYVEMLTDKDIEKLLDEGKTKAEKEIFLENKYLGKIKYLEWSGTRKHPKAEEKELVDVYIEERGCFYYVTDKNGKQILKKKMGSNGTQVINYKWEGERKKREEERILKKKEELRYMEENSSKEALDFYDQIYSDCDCSWSGHIYKKGRKPCPYDYDMGPEKFFKIGERRLAKTRGILVLEEWDGNKFVEIG